MLAYLLALAVGLGSVGLYMTAFALPEVHRKDDIIWSGVGLFYALVLWVCAYRITGGVLLGQIASVSLLGWFAWQTLMLRREALPKDQQTPLPTQAEIKQLIQNQIDRLTKGQANGATGGGTMAQLQRGVIGAVDRVTATVEETIAKFKKTPKPVVKVPPKAPVTPTVQAPPAAIETPVTPPVPAPPAAIETPVTPPVPAPPAAIETPVTPPVEPPVTPVDLVSPPDLPASSAADLLPTQETQFKSPTDEQVEAAIRDAESDNS